MLHLRKGIAILLLKIMPLRTRHFSVPQGTKIKIYLAIRSKTKTLWQTLSSSTLNPAIKNLLFALNNLFALRSRSKILFQQFPKLWIKRQSYSWIHHSIKQRPFKNHQRIEWIPFHKGINAIINHITMRQINLILCLSLAISKASWIQ